MSIASDFEEVQDFYDTKGNLILSPTRSTTSIFNYFEQFGSEEERNSNSTLHSSINLEDLELDI